MIGAARRGGILPLYKPGQQNVCTQCGTGAWHLGRFSATCMGCENVLDLASGNTHGAGITTGTGTPPLMGVRRA